MAIIINKIKTIKIRKTINIGTEKTIRAEKPEKANRNGITLKLKYFFLQD